MRKADKPKLSAAIWNYVDLQTEHPKNASFVIDGGSSLQKIQGWPKGSTFKSICKPYKDYVLKHYGAGTTVFLMVVTTNHQQTTRHIYEDQNSDKE